MHKLNKHSLDPVTVAEVKDIARTRLDPAVWDYYTTGADDEYSLRRNDEMFRE